jgi:hypothetical protein
MVKCKLVNTIDSSNISTPVEGLVTDDLVWGGKIIIAKNSQVHGLAQVDKSRERIAAEGAWTFTLFEQDHCQWGDRELVHKVYALDREDDPEFKALMVGATVVDPKVKIRANGYGFDREGRVLYPGTGSKVVLGLCHRRHLNGKSDRRGSRRLRQVQSDFLEDRALQERVTEARSERDAKAVQEAGNGLPYPPINPALTHRPDEAAGRLEVRSEALQKESQELAKPSPTPNQ